MNTLSGIKSKIWNFHLYVYFHSVNEILTINFVYFTSETLLLGTSQFINIYVSYPPRGSCSEKLWLSSLNCCSWLQNEGSTFVCGVTDCPVLPDPMVSTNTVCFFFSDKETKTNIHGSLTMSLSRDGKIHTELITNQMTGIVTMPS